MPGAALQLLAHGPQGALLTGDVPVFTENVFVHQHINFATETFYQDMSRASWQTGARSSATLERHGDLLTDLWIELRLPPGMTRSKDLAHVTSSYSLIERVTVTIGGQTVASLDSFWMYTHAELYLPPAKYDALAGIRESSETVLYVPLPLWFTTTPSRALPMCALLYQDMQVTCDLGSAGDAFVEREPPTLRLMAEYVFLDSAERRRVVAKRSTFLVEQCQSVVQPLQAADLGGTVRVRLPFSNPVRDLRWGAWDPTQGADLSSLRTLPGGWYSEAKLEFNGTERCQMMPPQYYQLIQPYKYYARTPAASAGVSAFSFSLRPVDPTSVVGFCDMSRLSSKYLVLKVPVAATERNLVVTCASYNVLTIDGGCAGLLWA